MFHPSIVDFEEGDDDELNLSDGVSVLQLEDEDVAMVLESASIGTTRNRDTTRRAAAMLNYGRLQMLSEIIKKTVNYTFILILHLARRISIFLLKLWIDRGHVCFLFKKN